jgi:leader peptidase (prepilin peptidase)/N-methyltransferase
MFLALGLVSALLFVAGAAVGSFLNVVIYRSLDDEPTSKKESWVTGRSRCDECGHQIAWYDNIPLFSYLILRGKCRNCKSRISLAHPVIELLTGVLFVWWYWGGAFFFQLTKTPFQVLQPLFWLCVGMVLIMILLADFLYYIIPDTMVAILTILTVVYRVALVSYGEMRFIDLAWAIGATVVFASFFALLWLGTRGKGMGLGDAKLMIPLGLLLGWPAILVGVFLAFLSGAATGVVLVILGKRKLGQIIPFGPFLILGSFVALIWGDQLVSWYMGMLR